MAGPPRGVTGKKQSEHFTDLVRYTNKYTPLFEAIFDPGEKKSRPARCTTSPMASADRTAKKSLFNFFSPEWPTGTHQPSARSLLRPFRDKRPMTSTGQSPFARKAFRYSTTQAVTARRAGPLPSFLAVAARLGRTFFSHSGKRPGHGAANLRPTRDSSTDSKIIHCLTP